VINKNRFRLRAASREALEGYLWLTPWLVGLIVFTLGPILGSLYFSFTAYHPARSPHWIGWQNYIVALTRDEQFWPSLGRTFYYAALLVPLVMVGSLALAMLLNQRLIGNSLYRTAYFLPYVTPVVAAALLWSWMLHPQLGIVNYSLKLVGIRGPSWLSAQWAIPTVAIISLWSLAGGSRMVVLLAALKNVPQELLIPGQGGIASGPAGFSLYFYVVKLFDHAFNFFEMGYASAMAWIFLIIVLFFTVLQFRSSSWVYYAGEEREA
jgi:multiple sugar transport system permease protein